MWKKLSSKDLFTHPRLSLIEDEVLLPNGLKTTYLKFKDDGHCGVTIIARNSEGKILLQKYRKNLYLATQKKTSRVFGLPKKKSTK